MFLKMGAIHIDLGYVSEMGAICVDLGYVSENGRHSRRF